MSGWAGFWIGLGLFFGLDCLGAHIGNGLIGAARKIERRPNDAT